MGLDVRGAPNLSVTQRESAGSGCRPKFRKNLLAVRFRDRRPRAIAVDPRTDAAENGIAHNRGLRRL
jgi:hypothetical protein